MKEIVVKHPLIEHKMSILRNIDTGSKEFRELVSEITILLAYEAMKNVRLKPIEVTTPMGKMTGGYIDESEIAFVPILRAGLGMVDGIIKVLPKAQIGHIGMYRDEKTAKPIPYYYKVPKNIENRVVYLLDPMLATGGSACSAINQLKEKGVKKIIFLCIVSAPVGIKKIQKEHPEVQIYTAALDDHLNDINFIVPGLGDAGDRIFGTI